MDFHALPRRELQALCKRNSIRANMTNAAMADALGALPAVDGIEKYVKQPVAEPAPAAKPAVKAVAEEVKQGIRLPRGRRVTSKSPEPVMREDGEKDEGNLERDEHEDDAPALGVGRRGASRRARIEPVVTAATRTRRAAASKTMAGDVAAEAVPARTTGSRSQMTVALIAEEDVPRARRTTRRAVTRKTGMQQEEEGEGPKGVASDVETTVPSPVSDEGYGDPEGIEEAMNPLNEEQNEAVKESSQGHEATPAEDEPLVAEDCAAVQEGQVDVEQCQDSPIVLGLLQQEGELHEAIHRSSEETEMVPVKEAPQATLKSGEATEEVGFTGNAGRATQEQNEVPTFDEVLHSTAKANEAGKEDGFLLEEKEDVAVDEVLHDTVVAVEEEGMVATNKTPQNSATMDEGLEVVTVTDDESADKERAFTGDLPPVVDTANDCGDQSTSPLFDAATKSLTMDSITVELTGSAADDVPLCNGGGETNNTELVADKERAFTGDLPPVVDTANDCGDQSTSPLFDDATKSLTMDSITVELTGSAADDVPLCNGGGETNNTELVADKERAFTGDLPPVVDTANDCGDQSTSLLFDDATKSLTMDSITVELTGSAADDVPLCNGGGETNNTELMALEQEKEVKEGNNSEALGTLSLRKLRVKLKETVAVEQDKEVMEGKKKSMALDKLSLRKLRVKLRETLIAHKNREPNRVALGRLDENVC